MSDSQSDSPGITSAPISSKKRKASIHSSSGSSCGSSIAGSNKSSRNPRKRRRSPKTVSRAASISDGDINNTSDLSLDQVSGSRDGGLNEPTKRRIWLNENDKPVYFRFLDLPGEIRNEIYDYGLVPGSVISLRTTADHIPSGVVSRQDLSMTLVNRQTHLEVETYYATNVFIANINLDPAADRLIPARHLSDENMSKIRKLVLNVDLITVDATDTPESLIDTVDFETLEHLNTLTNLTICATAFLEDIYNGRAQQLLEVVIGQIIQYIPPLCTVSYGSSNQETQDHIGDLLRKHLASVTGFTFAWPYRVHSHVLHAAAAAVTANQQIVQGAKNLAYEAKQDADWHQSMEEAEKRIEKLEEQAKAEEQEVKRLEAQSDGSQ